MSLIIIIIITEIVYGIIAHCNGRQIFPGRAQLIAKQQEDVEDGSIIRASSSSEKPSVHELG
jgi:hypothetical protein